MFSGQDADRSNGNLKFCYLMLGAAILLFTMLGSHGIWTQEHRWADVVYSMFYYHDFLHPVLNGNEYYDKPLLSYWLIAAIASLLGQINTWALRIPSALAGLVAIGSIYWIGQTLKNKSIGLLAGWMLLTTFFFIFWAHVSSTDMLNLGGTLLALAWFIEKRTSRSFFNYSIFFLVIAVTALCKGLVAPVVVFLSVLPEIILRKSLKQYLCDWRLFAALLPALLVYSLPFIASLYIGGSHYQSNGFVSVYRENIIRYFHPYDHQEPIYLYFYYLPIYLLPWTFFFIPAIFYHLKHWRASSHAVKWSMWTLLLLFVFFTMSGSRRGYYVLPLIPFAILLTSEWIFLVQRRMLKIVKILILMTYFLILVNDGLIQPWYYSKGGVMTFDRVLQKELSHRPPTDWHFSLLDAETKLTFYLHLSPEVKNYGIVGLRQAQTLETLKKTWPTLVAMPKDTIFISRRLYEPILNSLLIHYTLVEAEPTFEESFFHRKDPDSPVAYVPIVNG